MSMNFIFNCLLKDKNTEPLYEVIQEVKDSIPQSQMIGKGIVWSLRQLRKQIITEKVPLSIKKQSLEVLINSDRWQVRHLASLIATNCSSEENDLAFVLPVIEAAATDKHFAVRESAQMAMRELLQVFPDQVLSLYDDKWLFNPIANIRRCVSESLRPVLVEGKNWIREKPEEAIKRLKQLNLDSSLYVRKSVGNNLADISRRHPNLVINTLQKWLDRNSYDKKTLFIARKACRRVIKSHPVEVNKLLKGKPIIK